MFLYPLKGIEPDSLFLVRDQAIWLYKLGDYKNAKKYFQHSFPGTETDSFSHLVDLVIYIVNDNSDSLSLKEIRKWIQKCDNRLSEPSQLGAFKKEKKINDDLIIKKYGTKWGAYQKDNTEILPPIFQNIYQIDEAIIVKIHDLYGFINNKGEYLEIPVLEHIGSTFSPSDSSVSIQMNNKVGLFNYITGEYQIYPIYDRLTYFSEGLALVENDSKVGYVNKHHELIIPFIFEDGEAFQDNLAYVKYKNWWGFINKKGKFIIPAKFEVCTREDSLINCILSSEKYTYNKQGELIKREPLD